LELRPYDPDVDGGIATPAANDFIPTIDRYAEEHGVPRGLARALFKQESSFNPRAVNASGAAGMGQLMPDTAESLGVTDRFDPEQNIPASLKYLREGFDREGTTRGALQYYYGGPDKKQWGKNTVGYPDQVLRHTDPMERGKWEWSTKAKAMTLRPYDPEQDGQAETTPSLTLRPYDPKIDEAPVPQKPSYLAQLGDVFAGESAAPPEAPPQPATTGSVIDSIPNSGPAPGAPVRPEMRQAIEAQMTDPAADEALMQDPSYRGQVARQIAPERAARVKMLYDEAITKGATPEDAQAWAERNTASPDAAAASPTDFDFQTAKKYEDANVLTRAAVKTLETGKQQAGGIVQAGLDLIGADSDRARDLNKSYQQAVDAMGEGRRGSSYMEQQLEGALVSIGTQGPQMLYATLGAPAAAAVGLGAMFMQQAGQEYTQGRAKGLSQGDAFDRAAFYGTAEVIGEIAGIPAARRFAQGLLEAGVPTKHLMHALAEWLIKEQGGEQLTTHLEFGFDKLAPTGLNKGATLEDYLNAVRDTAVQTTMQTLLVGGAGTAAKRLAGTTQGAMAAQAADDARTQAMQKWGEFNALLRGEANPGASTGAVAQQTTEGVSNAPIALREATPDEVATAATPERHAQEAQFAEKAVAPAANMSDAVREAARLSRETNVKHRARLIEGTWHVIRDGENDNAGTVEGENSAGPAGDTAGEAAPVVPEGARSETAAAPTEAARPTDAQVPQAVGEATLARTPTSTTGPASLTGHDSGVPPEVVVQGGSRDAHRVSDLFDVETLRREGLSALDVPSNRMVLGAVIDGMHDPKIRDSVVGRVAIDVVNMLRGTQFTPEELSHDPSMLKNFLAVASNVDVSTVTDPTVFRRLASAVPFVADRVAELPLKSSSKVSSTREAQTALDTRQIDPAGGGSALSAAEVAGTTLRERASEQKPDATVRAVEGEGKAAITEPGHGAHSTEEYTKGSGEVVHFDNEQAALNYRLSKRLPRTWKPQPTEDGRVTLARPAKEKSANSAQSQTAMARARLRPEDDLLTAIGKVGGLNRDAVARDGVDQKHFQEHRFTGAFGKPPFRANGGLTLDGMAEALSQEGWDVLDEGGRVDATKLRELLDDALSGNKVYSPEGQMIQASKSDEAKALEEATKLRAVDVTTSGYEHLSEADQAAVDDALESVDQVTWGSEVEPVQSPREAEARARANQDLALSKLTEDDFWRIVNAYLETPYEALDRRTERVAGEDQQALATGTEGRQANRAGEAAASPPSRTAEVIDQPPSSEGGSTSGTAFARAKAPELALTGETEAQIKVREAQEKKAAVDKAKTDNAPPPENFTLTGSDRPADVAEAHGQKPMFARTSDDGLRGERKMRERQAAQAAEAKKQVRIDRLDVTVSHFYSEPLYHLAGYTEGEHVAEDMASASDLTDLVGPALAERIRANDAEGLHRFSLAADIEMAQGTEAKVDAFARFTPLTVKSTGLPAFVNAEVTLANARAHETQPVEKGLKRIAFDLIDSRVFKDNVGTVGYERAAAKAKVGDVLMLMRGHTFDSLENIQIYPGKRGKGYGEKAVRSMLESQDTPIRVLDIQPDAVDFWAKMGAHFPRSQDYMEAKLDRFQYATYQRQHGREETVRDVAANREGDARPQDARNGSEGRSDVSGRGEPAANRAGTGNEASVIPHEQQEALGQQIVASWANGPDFRAIRTIEEAPKAVRGLETSQNARGAEGAPYAFFHDDTIWIITSQIHSLEQLVTGIFHEGLGHYGLRGAFGEQLAPLLSQIVVARRAEVTAKAKEYGLDMGKRADRLIAAEEVLAELAQTRPEIGFVRRAIAAIRTYLREKLGVKLRMTDAEIIRNFILPARKYVEEGKGATPATLKETTFHRAYHGTPHDFDKFSTEHIGSGEGAQAYGWGLYFAGKREVAEFYRDKLSDPDGIHSLISARKHAIELYKQRIVEGFDRGIYEHSIAEAQREIAEMEAKQKKGRLFEVELAPKEDEYLDWDKPFSEQSEHVRKVLNVEVAKDTEPSDSKWVVNVNGRTVNGFQTRKAAQEWADQSSARSLYRALATASSPRKASASLLDAGIPGIKYLDGSSRSTANPNAKVTVRKIDLTFPSNGPPTGPTFEVRVEGMGRMGPTTTYYDTLEAAEAKADQLRESFREHHNYVIFDEKRVEVKAKFARAKNPADYGERLAKLESSGRTLSETVSDLFQSDRTFNWWHRSIGTQYHKAQVDKLPGVEPGGKGTFGAVYNKAQDHIHEFSRAAIESANMAPTLLPQIDGLRGALKSIVGAASKADIAAVQKPILDGTLQADDGNPHEGKVWTEEALRSRFKLNDGQVKLYREYRAAVDHSLDLLLTSEVGMLARDEDVPAAIAQARDNPGKAGEIVGDALAARAEAIQKEIGDLIDPRKPGNRGEEAITKQGEARRLLDLATLLHEKQLNIESLKAHGYAPLMRFGNYPVSAYETRGKDQVLIYFSLHESQREANAIKREVAKMFPKARVEGGVKSEESYHLYQGLTPDTLELFAQTLGVGENPVFQEYIRVAKNSRSALKRLINRKGVAGFEVDPQRTLAAFITSNARAVAGNWHMGEMTKAVEDIPAGKGDVKDEAVRLLKYLQNPQEKAQAVRGFLFVNYLGGSISAALVNMTQPLTMSYPYLAQFGAKRASTALPVGMAKAVSNAGIAPELRAALVRGEEEGIVAPHEVHMLHAEAMRSLGSNLWTRRLLTFWGSFFAAAEAFNRRSTFIAAWDVAKQTKQSDPYRFAVKAVEETQGVYNRGNRPDWARGTLGSTIFTFKQFSISYLEFLKRLPPRERAIALAIMFLLAGSQGLPFAEDIEDILDTIAQALGYSFNSRQAFRKWATDILGTHGAQFVMHGASHLEGVPLDVQGRLGMGNLIPGTSALKLSTADAGKEALDVLGPIGAFTKNAIEGGKDVFSGDVGQGLGKMAPVAVQNVMKAVDMWRTGMYRDTKGRKVIDTTPTEAAIKGIGFQLTRVAEDSKLAGEKYQNLALHKKIKDDISEKWAQGRFELVIASNDAQRETAEKKITDAKDDLAKWNDKNPEDRIKVDPLAIQRRVREMRVDRNERLIKHAPREMRQQMREDR
jgi:hypothetical protein